MDPVGQIDEIVPGMVANGRRRPTHAYIPNQDEEIEKYLECSSCADRPSWRTRQLQ